MSSRSYDHLLGLLWLLLTGLISFFSLSLSYSYQEKQTNFRSTKLILSIPCLKPLRASCCLYHKGQACNEVCDGLSHHFLAFFALSRWSYFSLLRTPGWRMSLWFSQPMFSLFIESLFHLLTSPACKFQFTSINATVWAPSLGELQEEYRALSWMF